MVNVLTYIAAVAALNTAVFGMASNKEAPKPDDKGPVQAPDAKLDKADKKNDAKADVKKTFTEEEQAAIRALVSEEILAKPEIIVEAIRKLQMKQEQEEIKRMGELVKKNLAQIYATDNIPFNGNEKGSKVLVVFSDYNCSACRTYDKSLAELVTKDPDVKIIRRQFPIRGTDSQKAARAALAAHRQGKFDGFHNELMKVESAVNDEKIQEAASKVKGLDVAKLRQDMDSSDIKKLLEESRKLAEALELNATPMTVVGEMILPGAADAETLRKVLESTSKK